MSRRESARNQIVNKTPDERWPGRLLVKINFNYQKLSSMLCFSWLFVHTKLSVSSYNVIVCVLCVCCVCGIIHVWWGHHQSVTRQSILRQHIIRQTLTRQSVTRHCIIRQTWPFEWKVYWPFLIKKCNDPLFDEECWHFTWKVYWPFF